MNDTLKRQPKGRLFSHLNPKAIEDFGHRREENGIRIGFDYYYRIAPYAGDAHGGLVVIELGILNGTGQSIQVRPTDFAFTYAGQPVRSTQVEFDAVAMDLVDRGCSVMDWLGVRGSPAYPYEVILLLPLLFVGSLRRSGVALKDYIAWRRGKRALRRISFDYDVVPAGQVKHGLIFFRVDMSDDQRATWPEKWDLSIDVLRHSIGPLVSEKAFSLSDRFSPYLPGSGCIVLILAVQFACLTGACYLAERILLPGLMVVPFLCGAAYLVVALLLILALASDFR